MNWSFNYYYMNWRCLACSTDKYVRVIWIKCSIEWISNVKWWHRNRVNDSTKSSKNYLFNWISMILLLLFLSSAPISIAVREKNLTFSVEYSKVWKNGAKQLTIVFCQKQKYLFKTRLLCKNELMLQFYIDLIWVWSGLIKLHYI